MFDAHCHIGIPSAQAIVCSSEPGEYDQLQAYRYHAYGLLRPADRDVDTLEQRLFADGGAMIGEFGLDCRWETDERLVERLLCIARDLDRPFVLHVVHRHDRILRLIKQVGTKSCFIVHGFTSSRQTALSYMRLGGTISLSPRSLASRDFRRLLDLGFLLESDLPLSDESLKVLDILYESVAAAMSISRERLEERINVTRSVFTA